MTTSIIIFQNNVKYLRQKLNLTQNELADLSGVSVREIGKIERGVVNPSLSTIHNIAQGFGMDVAQILDIHLSPENTLYEFENVTQILISEIARLNEDEQRVFLSALMQYVKQNEEQAVDNSSETESSSIWTGKETVFFQEGL